MRILIALFLCIATGALADVPKLTSRVTDQASILSHAERAALSDRLKEIEDRNPEHPQVVILTVLSLEGQTIRDVANQIFRASKLGQAGKDNGVLIMLAPEERQLRIEVGYGLEGVLPDTKASRIIDKMKNKLRKGSENYAASFGIALDELSPLLAISEATKAEKPGGSLWWWLFLIGGGGLVAFVWSWISAQKQEARRSKAFAERRASYAQPSPVRPTRCADYVAGTGLGAGIGAGAAIAAAPRQQTPTPKRTEESRRSRSSDDGISPSSSWSNSSSPSSSDSSSFSGGGGDSGGGGSDSSF